MRSPTDRLSHTPNRRCGCETQTAVSRGRPRSILAVGLGATWRLQILQDRRLRNVAPRTRNDPVPPAPRDVAEPARVAVVADCRLSQSELFCGFSDGEQIRWLLSPWLRKPV